MLYTNRMKPVVLIVLDGFGIAPPGPGNPISLANPPHINSYFYTYPNTTLSASGEAVGLPTHEAGNTEVGHINLGAGRVVYQDLPRINMSIADGMFYKNPAFLKAANHVKKTGGKLHLIGLVGEGTVHSSGDHLSALLHFAKENQLSKVYVHVITDGRDSPPKSASEIIPRLEEKIIQLGVGKIASVMGRYFAMDRDRRWERIQKAYMCYTKGEGERAPTAHDAIATSYKLGKTDEFVEPTIISSEGSPASLIEANDAVIFYNYRIDRPRELTKAFVLDNFEKDANITTSFDPYAVKYYKTHLPKEQLTLTPPFSRGPKIQNLLFITMTEYEKDLPVEIAFPPTVVDLPLGRLLGEHEIPQLRMAESEKERFVTFYFNGGREQPFPHEERLIIPSPRVHTYDQKPEMSAVELTDILVSKLHEQKYPFTLINFANADMVGHTGNIEACVKAIQTLDSCLEKIVQTVLSLDGTVLITADHGNVEQKINPQTSGISTEHTHNPVPFIAINAKFKGRLQKLQNGVLADIAPTILNLMGLTKPSQMTGRNLLEEARLPQNL
ncbi:phosphoglycerate mutase (2,3-diphosphoglycerate-independent) [Candidatus Roizmanbacteria bacterium RIFCSPLOWO2_12_FULL_40_12]|uniref:2,3-bisphosphoglycerate-independent phosphoglycerate mutase n=1 Tax=Candidatus Roizmanbacteria bacterium RIFCSPLOWO2_01_FULL_40_42 TaxID=1802066 RepID=A0A1F7J5S6_9BACT|nr:MAG: phosphoglycerate mutase (2,3-diphosphoglycerate-independent) [Candidatus Roizmanbacteria bacterium RIFCSPHIGHO2_01_FULL_40_98]OGK28396.1 MAG: phosphoglycerate mutase (2,3-diphosphoglycerate-independent) [Candidatus Roizmanbacteria bacterium RIFCSPHIGHO2_02_FULL_40_53]OGK30632.1 MAG: phosphoglycerate mutase (2,3-diphosphoglycerate-independent) [Candidatus Roizmanbacteria bacterium RIFCSPHIGHO2_12_41_18]OGK35960.1 MAG: phosphoglycerate mutase (2,3-diphosphoglycerate-independent) [Candidatu